MFHPSNYKRPYVETTADADDIPRPSSSSSTEDLIIPISPSEEPVRKRPNTADSAAPVMNPVELPRRPRPYSYSSNETHAPELSAVPPTASHTSSSYTFIPQTPIRTSIDGGENVSLRASISSEKVFPVATRYSFIPTAPIRTSTKPRIPIPGGPAFLRERTISITSSPSSPTPADELMENNVSTPIFRPHPSRGESQSSLENRNSRLETEITELRRMVDRLTQRNEQLEKDNEQFGWTIESRDEEIRMLAARVREMEMNQGGGGFQGGWGNTFGAPENFGGSFGPGVNGNRVGGGFGSGFGIGSRNCGHPGCSGWR